MANIRVSLEGVKAICEDFINNAVTEMDLDFFIRIIRQSRRAVQQRVHADESNNCPACNGTGEYMTKPGTKWQCSKCYGSGQL